MNKPCLIVVDMQRDFVRGALGSKEAEAIVRRVEEKVRRFSGLLLFTQDTHGENYAETQEGRQLPVPHCLRGTEGWELLPELEEIRRRRGARVFEKDRFGSLELAAFLKSEFAAGRVTSAELIGLCTDICVLSNAILIKATVPELPLSVDASCCAGVSPETHEAALRAMQSCQIRIDRPADGVRTLGETEL